MDAKFVSSSVETGNRFWDLVFLSDDGARFEIYGEPPQRVVSWFPDGRCFDGLNTHLRMRSSIQSNFENETTILELVNETLAMLGTKAKAADGAWRVKGMGWLMRGPNTPVKAG